jgi:hypothetical protein
VDTERSVVSKVARTLNFIFHQLSAVVRCYFQPLSSVVCGDFQQLSAFVCCFFSRSLLFSAIFFSSSLLLCAVISSCCLLLCAVIFSSCLLLCGLIAAAVCCCVLCYMQQVCAVVNSHLSGPPEGEGLALGDVVSVVAVDPRQVGLPAHAHQVRLVTYTRQHFTLISLRTNDMIVFLTKSVFGWKYYENNEPNIITVSSFAAIKTCIILKIELTQKWHGWKTSCYFNSYLRLSKMFLGFCY